MNSPVPAPPDFRAVTPLFRVSEQGELLARVYSTNFRENEFNPHCPGAGVWDRFHLYRDAAGPIVLVLYGSGRDDSAITETIFHDVSVHGVVRPVMESRLDEVAIVTLEPRATSRSSSCSASCCGACSWIPPN